MLPKFMNFGLSVHPTSASQSRLFPVCGRVALVLPDGMAWIMYPYAYAGLIGPQGSLKDSILRIRTPSPSEWRLCECPPEWDTPVEGAKILLEATGNSKPSSTGVLPCLSAASVEWTRGPRQQR